MSNIERPGVNPKWLKKMKTWHKDRGPAAALEHRDRNLEELEHYVAHGISKATSEEFPNDRRDWRRDAFISSMNVFITPNATRSNMKAGAPRAARRMPPWRAAA